MSFPELSHCAKELFATPSYGQRLQNICSMVNFFPEASRLMDCLDVTSIVEIGSESGVNTNMLLKYIKGRGGTLTTVDPADVHFPFDPAKEPAFSFARELSAQFLTRNHKAEIIFMDGDHNYETVLADLEKIHDSRGFSGIKMLFLHDVSWPWARRDIYYAPERIVSPHPHHADIRVSPYVENNGVGLAPAGYMTADVEGGDANGVLTAVEDFLAHHGNSWKFWRIPVLYGIGILLSLDTISQAEGASLIPMIEELTGHSALLSILELNRVENLIRIQSLEQCIQKSGDTWRSDQSYIRQLNLDVLPELTTEKALLTNALTTVKQEYEKQASLLMDAESCLRKKEAELSDVQKMLSESRQICEAQTTQCAEVLSRLTAREAELEEANLKLAKCLQSNDAQRRDLESQTARIHEIEASLIQLKMSLDESRCLCGKQSTQLDECHAQMWQRDQKLRQMTLATAREKWRCNNFYPMNWMPYSVRNGSRLKRIRSEICAGEIKILSLDVFDTLLFREAKSELKRFQETSRLFHKEFPRISAEDFYYARALAHRMAYQTCPVCDGCREASADMIFRIMARILQLEETAGARLKEIELEYERSHLVINELVWQLARLAAEHGMKVIAVSDMYWGAAELSRLLNELLPEKGTIEAILSSCDEGVSKSSGLLFDRVLRRFSCPPSELMHVGDNFNSDFQIPFVRNGIQAIWMPRSDGYTKFCHHQQGVFMKYLHKRSVIHGL